MIDTHTHIYLPGFDNDRDAVMERGRSAGLNRFFLPAIDSSTHEVMMRVEANYQGCSSMMGVHPCSVNQNFEKELLVVEEYLDQRKFIAIGEIGLDFHWDRTFTDQQFEAFHRQIVMAMNVDLPIVIHSRDATTECIEVVRKYPGLRGVFHCFSGNVVQARQIMELGFFLGIGGVVTFKNSGLDKVVQEIGTSQLVLETDAPYLAPVPFRGKRNEPAYTRLVAEKIAVLLNLSVEEVEELTTENAKNLFKL